MSKPESKSISARAFSLHEGASLFGRVLDYCGVDSLPETVEVLVEVLETNVALGLVAGAQHFVGMSDHPHDANFLIKDLKVGSDGFGVPACDIGSEIAFLGCTFSRHEGVVQASSFRVLKAIDVPVVSLDAASTMSSGM